MKKLFIVAALLAASAAEAQVVAPVKTTTTMVYFLTAQYNVSIPFSGVGNGNARNYAGLFASNAPTAVMLAWKYLDNTTDITNTSRNATAGTVTFANLTAPTYEVRFYNNDLDPKTPDQLVTTVSIMAPMFEIQRRDLPAEGNVTVTRTPVGNRDEVRIVLPSGNDERITMDRGVAFSLRSVNDAPTVIAPVVKP
jgi:hypothetical protein